jgi:small subunit ribosomal protein S17
MTKEGSQVADRGLAKTQEGVVVSSAMNKSIVVGVETFKQHAQYGKYMRSTKKYMAHDEKNECAVGDKVRIVETRPLSKNKRWRLQAVVEKAL